MSQETKKLRSEFYRAALAQGWTSPAQVTGQWKELIPLPRLERWYARLFQPHHRLELPSTRLANRFEIGADPEFIILQQGSRIDAHQFGLKAGVAFGADNNGRLVELRPMPSRSALAVVASLWATMYWLSRYHPKTVEYDWRSGGFAEGDGLGGHIHYGRKRLKSRSREIQGLDRITHLMFVSGIFDIGEGRARYKQAHGGHYGHPGDVRVQPHGWEYRTLPSWLDTPWLAYFTLTMGKLVVAFPDLFPPLTKEDGVLGADSARGLLRLYLAYFASLDDDARLAYSILARRGLPRHSSGMDIKGNWGIIPPAGPLSVQVKCPNVFPDAIPASEALQLELAESMYEGLTLQPQGIEPSWMPSAIPSNYVQMVRRVTTHLAPGIGEISAGIAFYRDTPVFFAPSENDPSDVTLSPDWLPAARAARLVEKLRPYTIKFRPLEEEFILIANKRLSLNDMLKIRDILVKSEVFPLWFLSDVRPDSFERWRARIDKITPRPFSKIIYTSKVR